jgi:hypothetical protein
MENINIQDITIIKNLFVAAATKGMIHPNEFTHLGKTYDKICAIEKLLTTTQNNGN